MEKEGWDGKEDEDGIQWTFAGALFYSIVVITTIGESSLSITSSCARFLDFIYNSLLPIIYWTAGVTRTRV